jgi:hypothetical protein
VNGYAELLGSLGVDDDYIQGLMNSVDDDIRQAKGFGHINVLPSKVHGLGLFTSKKIHSGDIVSPMRSKNGRTTAGRFTNHSDTPNAYPKFIDGVISLVAINDIGENEEITVDYYKVITTRLAEGEIV